MGQTGACSAYPLTLNSGEYGNYLAGYITQARFGSFGMNASLFWGEADNVIDYTIHVFRSGLSSGPSAVTTPLDPLSDQDLIMMGAMDAARDYGHRP
jgi:hypothetical protein